METPEETQTEDDWGRRIIGLGAKVVSKKTGLPAIGFIMGHVHPKVWAASTGRAPEDMHRWNECYPGWEEKLLYHVLYQEPQLPFSYKEFIASIQKAEMQTLVHSMSEDELKQYYQRQPRVGSAMFPMDDVELFEQEEG